MAKSWQQHIWRKSACSVFQISRPRAVRKTLPCSLLTSSAAAWKASAPHASTNSEVFVPETGASCFYRSMFCDVSTYSMKLQQEQFKTANAKRKYPHTVHSQLIPHKWQELFANCSPAPRHPLSLSITAIYEDQPPRSLLARLVRVATPAKAPNN